MLRKATPASSMQKTYDECYLHCSTAIYFESQNNEAEALRAWRTALDQIYFHNAYRIPSGYQPRSETEKALQDSLKSMELQCKERVDLLEALRKSRKEAEKEAKNGGSNGPSQPRQSHSSAAVSGSNGEGTPWLGDNTIPQASYADIPRPNPAPERRPMAETRPSYSTSGNHVTDSDTGRSRSMVDYAAPRLAPPSVSRPRARTPSPEKKSGGMLKTLRTHPKERGSASRKRAPPAAAKAASQVWSGPQQRLSTSSQSSANGNVDVKPTWDPYTRTLVERPVTTARKQSDGSNHMGPTSSTEYLRPQHSDSSSERGKPNSNLPPYPDDAGSPSYRQEMPTYDEDPSQNLKQYTSIPPKPPPHKALVTSGGRSQPTTLAQAGPSSISYMKEYPNHPPMTKTAPPVPAKRGPRTKRDQDRTPNTTPVKSTTTQIRSSPGIPRKAVNKPPPRITPPTSDEGSDKDQSAVPEGREAWEAKKKRILKSLPKGVDETAAKQILNEIVIQGDEVHWDDVAGLEAAKSALKETVVYPFLRPDLFLGLREPARGMLLFGPPGTGKTMLARAVATESKSVFFAISASSLTSKYLGESEKLVRALFALAKVLAPSIIFVDEIDSILGSRGGDSEHEATRRIKTEFLIQWSDLQKAAAGREDKEGDPTRVLVLAATNLPWAIDEAARRRFVRRQYIPLPEGHVREQQLRTLLASQKHTLKDRDLKALVRLTENYSGSDITALAKDAAMGPLRSLGERLLHMSPEDIRGIDMRDFEASLVNIRPSVSRQGLKEFEDWARDYGERGG